MDTDVIIIKMESLRRCISRIELKRPDNVEILFEDYDIQDIISLNLERAIQISVDIASHLIADFDMKIPSTMGELFFTLNKAGVISKELAERLRKAVGFRNISVHEYDKIDWNIVFSLIHKRLNDFREFVKTNTKFY